MKFLILTFILTNSFNAYAERLLSNQVVELLLKRGAKTSGSLVSSLSVNSLNCNIAKVGPLCHANVQGLADTQIFTGNDAIALIKVFNMSGAKTNINFQDLNEVVDLNCSKVSEFGGGGFSCRITFATDIDSNVNENSSIEDAL